MKINDLHADAKDLQHAPRAALGAADLERPAGETPPPPGRDVPCAGCVRQLFTWCATRLSSGAVRGLLGSLGGTPQRFRWVHEGFFLGTRSFLHEFVFCECYIQTWVFSSVFKKSNSKSIDVASAARPSIPSRS